MEILLDGNQIANKADLYRTLKTQINSSEFHGSNLDSLWDVLTSFHENIRLSIVNSKQLKSNLQNYYDLLIDMFKELKKVNTSIILTIE